MPLAVTITTPADNGDPLPALLQATVVSGYRGALNVWYVLVDEADGSKSPPQPATFSGGYWQLAVAVLPKHFFTVVAVAVAIDPSGAVTDTGSDARIKCKAP